MTHPADPDHGNAYFEIARELARLADAHRAADSPQLGRAAAELGLVYLEFGEYGPLGDHGIEAYEAAEAARDSLAAGGAVTAMAHTAAARLHMGIDAIDRRRLDGHAPRFRPH
ncbi:hypothetical protein [Streptomyces jumonjinensis]|uniref:hypothetical protein n=1 Tax=Streptomyces jumonjinensis TaxID=1945 RepID=UPI003791DA5A